MEFIGIVTGWDIPEVPIGVVPTVSQYLNVPPSNLIDSTVRQTYKSLASHIARRSASGVNGKYFLQYLVRGKLARWVLVHQTYDRQGEAIETPFAYIDVDENFSVSVTPARNAPSDVVSALSTFTPPSTVSGAFIGVAVAEELRRCGAVPVRRAGGAYFVPRAFLERAEEYLSVIELSGGRVYRFYCTGQPTEQKTIFDSLRELLRDEVAQMRLRIDQAKRVKTLENMQSELPQLVERLDVYADILGIFTEELDGMKQEAQKVLQEAIKDAFARIEQQTTGSLLS